LNRFVARAAVIALLAALLAGHAAALCQMSSPPSSVPPCHRHRIPARPHPADHQCCVARAPSALPTNIFPATPSFPSGRVEETVFPVPIGNANIFSPEIELPFGPPDAIALRI
jgi:hypothetical protein